MIRSPLWEAPEAALPVPRPDQPGARPEGAQGQWQSSR